MASEEQLEEDLHAIKMLAIHGWDHQTAQNRFLTVLADMRKTIEDQGKRIKELERYNERREDHEAEQREY